MNTTMDIYEAEKALSFVDSSERELWLRMGAALKTEFGEEAKESWLRWSAQDKSFNSRDANSVWKSIKPGRINIGTLIYEAKRYGYTPQKSDFKKQTPQERAIKEAERKLAEQKAQLEQMKANNAAKEKAQRLYAKGHNVNPKHPYLINKGITNPDALKVIKQLGKNLLIPAYQNKELVGIQKITPEGGKYFGKYEQLNGSSLIIGKFSEAKEKGLLVAEGYATAASLYEAMNKPVLITFHAYNMKAMAEKLKDLDIKITFCADDDSHKKSTGIKYADQAANIIGKNATVIVPHFSEEDIAHYQSIYGKEKMPTDFNDLHKIKGLESVREQLTTTSKEMNM